jgi:hypothetical protein
VVEHLKPFQKTIPDLSVDDVYMPIIIGQHLDGLTKVDSFQLRLS